MTVAISNLHDRLKQRLIAPVPDDHRRHHNSSIRLALLQTDQNSFPDRLMKALQLIGQGFWDSMYLDSHRLETAAPAEAGHLVQLALAVVNI